jgi:uncharacterized cupin superfamily protein
MMYVENILTATLTPSDARTADLPFVDDGELQIGIWECTPGLLDEPTTDYDESMFMVSGRVTVTAPGSTMDIAPGTLWATPRHWPGVWDVHQTVRKVYVIDHRVGDAGAVAHLSNAHLLELGAPVPRPVVLGGDPRERSVDIWAHNRLNVGVWECTPGEFPFSRDGYDEVFTVLSGSATLFYDDGREFRLTPGSVILTPSGTSGRWVVDTTIRKAYTIVLGRG